MTENKNVQDPPHQPKKIMVQEYGYQLRKLPKIGD